MLFATLRLLRYSKLYVNSSIFSRCSGILLHVTSLPGGHGIGDLGNSAHELVEFLAEAYERAIEIVEGFGVKLGPRCIPCQHNTLTFPDGSEAYKYH